MIRAHKTLSKNHGQKGQESIVIKGVVDLFQHYARAGFLLRGFLRTRVLWFEEKGFGSRHQRGKTSLFLKHTTLWRVPMPWVAGVLFLSLPTNSRGPSPVILETLCFFFKNLFFVC